MMLVPHCHFGRHFFIDTRSALSDNTPQSVRDRAVETEHVSSSMESCSALQTDDPDDFEVRTYHRDHCFCYSVNLTLSVFDPFSIPHTPPFF